MAASSSVSLSPDIKRGALGRSDVEGVEEVLEVLMAAHGGIFCAIDHDREVGLLAIILQLSRVVVCRKRS